MGKKLWFKAKNFGWGWYPSSWQGWLIMIIYLVVIIKIFYRIDSTPHSGSDTLVNFVIPFIVSTIVLIIICYKTGEKPEWRWPRSEK
jgi:uncharacterized membrane protein YhaH (DUF805 family)